MVILVLNIMLAMGSFLEEDVFSFGVICTFMFLCGSGLTSVAWTYPNELCTAGV